MATADPITPQPRRFSIRLPGPVWIGVVTFFLIVVAVGLHFGVPLYRQRAAIREFERLGAPVVTRQGGPKWLRQSLGDERMSLFDDVDAVDLCDVQVTDATLAQLAGLSRLKSLSLATNHVTDAGLAHLKG